MASAFGPVLTSLLCDPPEMFPCRDLYFRGFSLRPKDCRSALENLETLGPTFHSGLSSINVLQA